MFEDLPIQPAPDSALGQLLAAFRQAETAAMEQRLRSTAASETFREASLSQRRAAYRSGDINRTEEREAELAHLQELERIAHLEARKLQRELDEVRTLRERFQRDYQEFYRLHVAMDEIRRLGG